ncbi:hypothetical protein [uncultured Endozoicomonas sp.]|uniref:hypothetical protein n=1 Tax=uncultured Endozoicomonas sp. TaxID=432652 RepID=UPI00260CC17E|nr:hypothetical protein [uncultured Endozoicomonas sp.]
MSTPISVIINRITIHGSITDRSHSDLTVTITDPITGLSCSAPHIPYFARAKKDYQTSLGEDLARELLTRLYHAARELQVQQDALQHQLYKPDGLKTALHKIRDEKTRLKQQKQTAKQQLKQGVLSQKAHQQQLKTLRQREEQLQSDEHELKENFMQNHLPQYSSTLDADEVLNWLGTTHNA